MVSALHRAASGPNEELTTLYGYDASSRVEDRAPPMAGPFAFAGEASCVRAPPMRPPVVVKFVANAPRAYRLRHYWH
jgi:hypothetical protein